VSPSATTVRFRWLRDGKAIAKATHRTYRVRSVDVGHRITVRVRVLRSGVTSATATTPARRIAR
jgi:hypothetical protein